MLELAEQVVNYIIETELLQICKVDKDFSQIAGIPLLEIFTVLSLQLLLTYAMKELPVASGMQFRVSNRKDSKLLLKSEAAFWDLNSSGEMFLYDKVIEYICIVMSMLIQRTDQEILMSFVASCIEDVADKLNLDYAEVYERMKVVGMIENYIIPHYDVLHTESRENVTAGMIDTLKRWEGQK